MREKIARAIDPEAMRTLAEWHAQAMRAAADIGANKNSPNIERLAVDNFASMAERRQAALAKADQILAPILSILPQWKGIESAPRDGTPVLVCDAEGNRGIARIRTISDFGQSFDSVSAAWVEGSIGSGVHIRMNADGDATRWMPLPSPPGEE